MNDSREFWLRDQIRSDLERAASALNKYVSITTDGKRMDEACSIRITLESLLTDIEKYL